MFIYILPADASVSPKACAEELGYTFLPCVLANLHRAPRLLHHGRDLNITGRSVNINRGRVLTAADVSVAIVPVRLSLFLLSSVLWTVLTLNLTATYSVSSCFLLISTMHWVALRCWPSWHEAPLLSL